MAQVPDDNIATVQEEPLPGRAYPHFSDEVPTGAFGSELGAGLERLGDRQQAAEDKAQLNADRVRATTAATQLTEWSTDAQFTNEDAAYKQTGQGAVNMEARYGGAFDEQVQQISSGLSNDQQRAMFMEHAQEQRREFSIGIGRYEYQQGQREASQAFENNLISTTKQYSMGYAGLSDPKTADAGRSQIMGAIAGYADHANLTAEDKKDLQGKAFDRYTGAIVDAALGDGNVDAADNYLQKYKGDLSGGEAYGVLASKIDAKRRESDNQDRTVSLKAVADQRSAYLLNQTGASSLATYDDYVKAYKGDADREYNATKDYADTGAAKARYDTQTPAEITEDLQKHNPEGAQAQPGAAITAELYGRRVAAAQQSIKEREGDSQQFLISHFNRQPIDWTKDQGTAIGQLEERMNTAGDDAKQLGVPVQPLSKQEVATLQQVFERGTTDNQLQLIGMMRDGLSTRGRFDAVFEQIAPTNPVIAAAAEHLPQVPSRAPGWYDVKHDSPPEVSADLLEGGKLLQPVGPEKAELGKGGARGNFPMPTEQVMNNSFNSHFTASDFAGDPIGRQNMYQAWRAMYAVQASKLNDYTGDLNNAAVKATVAALVPEQGRVGPTTVSVPRGMDPARFQDFVKGAERTNFSSRGLDPSLAEGHGVMPIGGYNSGRYVVMADAHHPMTYPGQGPNGEQVTIDLNAQYARSHYIAGGKIVRTTANTGTVPQTPPGPPQGRTSKERWDADFNPHNPADDLPAVEPGAGRGG